MAFAIVTLVGVAIMTTGVVAITAPQFAAQMYGLTVNESTANLFGRAAGARDVVIGGLLVASGWHASQSCSVGTLLLIAAIIPIADALIVFLVGQPRPRGPLALHVLSAIILTALGVWLRR